jgi:hypothetical protein
MYDIAGNIASVIALGRDFSFLSCGEDLSFGAWPSSQQSTAGYRQPGN